MTRSFVGRTLYFKVSALPNATTTTTESCPLNGYITSMDISLPTQTTIGDINYAVFLNTEQLYPSGPDAGYATRVSSGDDSIYINTPIREGDVLTLVVLNSNATTTYTIVANIVIEAKDYADGHMGTSKYQRLDDGS